MPGLFQVSRARFDRYMFEAFFTHTFKLIPQLRHKCVTGVLI